MTEAVVVAGGAGDTDVCDDGDGGEGFVVVLTRMTGDDGDGVIVSWMTEDPRVFVEDLLLLLSREE